MAAPPNRNSLPNIMVTIHDIISDCNHYTQASTYKHSLEQEEINRAREQN